MSRLRSDERGFTLIELLVTMSVGMIVMSGVLGLLDMTLRSSATSLGRTQAVREGRGAIDRVGQELRLASCPDTGSAVISADGDSVSYYVARPQSDPQLAPVVERHTLTYDRRQRDHRADGLARHRHAARLVGDAQPPRDPRHAACRAPARPRSSSTWPTTPRTPRRCRCITAPVAAASLSTIAAGPRDLHRARRATASAANGELALPERRRTAHRRPLRRGQHARMLILRNLLPRLLREERLHDDARRGHDGRGRRWSSCAGARPTSRATSGPAARTRTARSPTPPPRPASPTTSRAWTSNPSYWSQCIDREQPVAGQLGTQNFVNVPGSAARQYAIELLPTSGLHAVLDERRQASWSSSAASEFRIRVTGRPRAGEHARSARSSPRSGPRAS